MNFKDPKNEFDSNVKLLNNVVIAGIVDPTVDSTALVTLLTIPVRSGAPLTF